jgi:alanyl-tRNA synthetase
LPNQERIDIAFRVIADHIRTLSFAIADGIQPGNNDRNYVLRRILRRAVRYGRTLGFKEPFFYKLVDVLADTMGDVFPEIRAKKKQVQETIQREEEAFNKTLDRGINLFENEVFANSLRNAAGEIGYSCGIASTVEITSEGKQESINYMEFSVGMQQKVPYSFAQLASGAWRNIHPKFQPIISGADAFQLYDTYGFPLDLTELMARERGLTVDKDGFEK